MNEKLVERVNAAYDEALYRTGKHSEGMKAAIAAHRAFIREAAAREEIKVIGAMAVQERLPSDWDDIDPDDQREAIEWAEISFHAMLDQIERTPDEG